MNEFTIDKQKNARINQQRLSPYAIKNANIGAIAKGTGGPVINESGLVSEFNFLNDAIEITTLFTSTSSSYVAIPNATLTFTTQTDTTNVLVFFSLLGMNNSYLSGSNFGELSLFLDGSAYSRSLVFRGKYTPASGGVMKYDSLSKVLIAYMNKGEHTISLRAKNDDNISTIDIYEIQLGYSILGS